MEMLRSVVRGFSRSSVTEENSRKEETVQTSELQAKGGQVFSFGYGFFGQLGHGNSDSLSVPKLIPDLTQIVEVCCGDAFSVVVSKQGLVYSWGSNKYGQLGVGDTRDRLRPVYIEALKGVAIFKVACGAHHTLLLSKKEVLSCGCGTFGRLGHGDHTHQNVPRVITALKGKKISQISCGGSFSACLSEDGSLYTWGLSKFGQLGHGKLESQLTPKQVVNLHGIKLTMIACGKHHLIVVSENGTMYGCGLAQCGQITLKTKSPVTQLKSISGLPNTIDQIGCGSLHSLCSTNGGQKVFVWGYVTSDHLGISDGEEYHFVPEPIPLAGIKGRITHLFAGAWHSGLITAIQDEGQIYVWGFEYKGRLGNPIFDENVQQQSPLTPVQIPFFKDYTVLKAAGGGGHTIVLGIPKSI